MDRRVGGREHPHHPIEKRDASPESQDFRLEDNHDAKQTCEKLMMPPQVVFHTIKYSHTR